MKIYPIIFLTVLIVSQSETVKVEENIPEAFYNFASGLNLDKYLKQFLETFKEVMKKGNESLGIPPLDPYKSDPLGLSINWEDLQGEFSTKSIGISGLSNYNVINANLRISSVSKTSISLEWPKIEGNIIDYILSSGRVMNFVNFFGKGNANFFIENVKFSIETSMITNKTTKFLYLTSVKTNVSVADNGDNGDMEFYTEGLYDDRDISQLISSVISEIGPDAFATYYETLIKALNKLIMDTGNNFLDAKTWKDLIDIING